MNKQKTDWDKDFDKIIVDWEEIPISERLKIKGGYYGLMKDFISKTLQQQKKDLIKEIEGIVGEDEKDSIVWEVEVDTRNQLRKEIRERLKQITN